MAAKRKVDNLMALAVLATVVQQPMHRYEIASLMRARGKDQDMDVKWGSLYTVVKNLAKYGFLEVIGLLRARLGRLEESIAARRAAITEHLKEVPRLFLVEDEFAVAMVEAEAAWVRALLEELTSGSFPDLASWRAFHDGGEMPPALVELSERGLTGD